MSLIVGAPTARWPGERRVAVVPSDVARYQKLGVDLRFERGAGEEAGFPDSAFTAVGLPEGLSRDDLLATADLLLAVHPLGENERAGLREGHTVVGLLDPLGDPRAIEDLARRGVTAFALELLPRISRAQPMDALSSQATVAGYKAALLAANNLSKLYPMLITAAGTIAPARVLVLGAGVAGLQAIATSRRLGAVVHAYDIRPAVKEQVESLGARFLELEIDTEEAEAAGGYAREMDEEFYRRQRELLTQAVAGSDAVITTAAVPGRRAPVLVTADMVRAMAPGSVVIDLAAETGGNCELTRAGESVRESGVTVLGPVNLAASLPHHASQMLSHNLRAFVSHLIEDGQIRLDADDEILRETLVARRGEVTSERLRRPAGGAGQTT